MSVGQMAAQAMRLQDAFSALARIPKPTIAAVTGFALGGGLELALTADFRVLGDTARVGQPEILLGVIPGAGGTQRLARLIGPAKAKELIFSGRHVRADEALALGIADQVVPADDVYDEALSWAREYADGPAVALAAAKTAVDDGLGDGSRRGPAAGISPVRGPVRHRGPRRRDEAASSSRVRATPPSPATEPTVGDERAERPVPEYRTIGTREVYRSRWMTPARRRDRAGRRHSRPLRRAVQAGLRHRDSAS